MFAILLKLSADLKAANYAAAFQDFIALLQLMAKNPPSAVPVAALPTTPFASFANAGEAALCIDGICARHDYAAGSAEVAVEKIPWKSLWDLVTKLLPFLLPLIFQPAK